MNGKVGFWWYAIFGDGHGRPLLHRFLRKGFKHVDCFAFDPNTENWLIFRFEFDGIQTEIVPAGDQTVSSWISAYPGGGLVVRVPSFKHHKPPLWKPLSCVQAVIELTGFGSGALTPYALFRDLVRAKGEQTFVR